MTGLTVVLEIVATYRLTRIVTADRIMDRFRAWAERTNAYVGYLVTCDWCLSIWFAPLPTIAVLLWPDSSIVLGVLLALTASAGTGMLSLLERKWDR